MSGRKTYLAIEDEPCLGMKKGDLLTMDDSRALVHHELRCLAVVAAVVSASSALRCMSDADADEPAPRLRVVRGGAL